jgi:hypothetical protein
MLISHPWERYAQEDMIGRPVTGTSGWLHEIELAVRSFLRHEIPS